MLPSPLFLWRKKRKLESSTSGLPRATQPVMGGKGIGLEAGWACFFFPLSRTTRMILLKLLKWLLHSPFWNVGRRVGHCMHFVALGFLRELHGCFLLFKNCLFKNQWESLSLSTVSRSILLITRTTASPPTLQLLLAPLLHSQVLCSELYFTAITGDRKHLLYTQSL